MFPKNLRWLFLICAIAGVIGIFGSAFMVYLGEPSTRLVLPIGMAICFGWAFTQAAKT